jgi:hypothetical protein
VAIEEERNAQAQGPTGPVRAHERAA